MSLNGHSLKGLSSFTLYTLLAKYVKEMFSNTVINITKHNYFFLLQHQLTRRITRKTGVIMAMTRKTGVVMAMTRKTTVDMAMIRGILD